MRAGYLTALLLAASLPALEARAADVLTMQGDRQRTGWFSHETQLTPERLKSGKVGKLWESPELDPFREYPPRLYATPLYVDDLLIDAGEHKGQKFPVVIAATSSGFVYAINAAQVNGVAPGTILWKRQFDEPCMLQWDDSTMGILSTPIIDKARKVLYVASCGAKTGFKVYGLELSTGAVLDGWPVAFDEDALSDPSVDRNPRYGGPPPPRKPDPYHFYTQRGALNLSPDDRYLYLTMGQARGWVVAVDTTRKAVASSFSATPLEEDSMGGIWAATGVAVDPKGVVYAVTGASAFEKTAPSLRNWSQSVLAFDPLTPAGFNLRAVYTPFNYCRTAATDIDMGSSGAAIIPAPSGHPEEQMIAVGGKQGNAYLMGGSSFHPRGNRAQAVQRRFRNRYLFPIAGAAAAVREARPDNIFGPNSETEGMMDRAKNRSTAAYFRDAEGREFLFFSGGSKDPANPDISVAPDLVSLRLMRAARPGTISQSR